MQEHITIVIPTCHRLNRLKRVLAALEKQTVPAGTFDVVVVVDGAADNTLAYLQMRDAPWRLTAIKQLNAGAAAARNRGVKESNANIILFIDDDVKPDPQLVDAHMKSHAQHGPDVAVIGPMLTPRDVTLSPWVAWEQAQLVDKYKRMQSGSLLPNPHQFYTGNVSVPRQHFLAVGGFDTNYQRAEDLELAYRLDGQGLSFTFNPAAKGYHYAERSFSTWLAIPYIYGQNSVRFAHEKGHTRLLETTLASYKYHHSLVKALVNYCLDRPLAVRAAIWGLKLQALIAHRLGFFFLSRMTFSGLFNLQRYQGMADALGGRNAFYTALAAGGYAGG